MDAHIGTVLPGIQASMRSDSFPYLRTLKGYSHQNTSVANMIELLLKSVLVYDSPMFLECSPKAG